MPKSLSISKEQDFYPDHLSFKNLRVEGIRHIAQLSGKLWTDHNLHDPGISILEVLCYALTDLTYRNNLDIKDLLMQDPANPQNENNFFRPAEILTCNPLTINDYRKLLIDIEGVRNAWLVPATEAEIELYLDCANSKLVYSPNDIRAVEEEIEDVGDDLLNDGNDEIIPFIPIDVEATHPSWRPVKINGLYKVILELEDTTVDESAADCNAPITSDTVLSNVKSTLQAHRNLSEDFIDINILKDECVGVNAELELEPDANPEDVLVEVYNQLNGFLQPEISFYTLQEMLDKGKTMEEVFAGRPMTYDSFGFVDMEELELLKRREEIHASDIQREILKVPGVRGIKSLSLSSAIGAQVIRPFERWCLPLTNPNLYRPVFCPDRSNFCFYKGVLPFAVNTAAVNARFQKLNSNFSKAKKSETELDLMIPQGEYRADLGDYYSIQNDFPAAYMVGENELPQNNIKRKTQALQLKSYLLLFDQLLANYLGQLSNVRSIFSFDNSENANYAAVAPDIVPGVKDLLRSNNPIFNIETSGTFAEGDRLAIHPEVYNSPVKRDEALRKLLAAYQKNQTRILTKETECGFTFQVLNGTDKVWLEGVSDYDNESTASDQGAALEFLASQRLSYELIDRPQLKSYTFELIYKPESFDDFLQTINENTTDAQNRRNRFLNHLMARFGEHFTEYVLLMYAMNGQELDNDKIIQDKEQFLKIYPEISRNRGRGFDYLQPTTWNTNNVSGLENKVTRLMGITDWKRSNLNNFEIINAAPKYQFQIIDQFGNPAFISHKIFDLEMDAKEACAVFMEELIQDKLLLEAIDCPGESAYSFRLTDLSGCEILAVHPYTYCLPEIRTERANCLLDYFQCGGILYSIQSTKGGFYFHLNDNDGNLLFKSSDSYETAELAKLAFLNFLELSKDIANFQVVNNPFQSNFFIGVFDDKASDDSKTMFAETDIDYLLETEAESAISVLQDWIVNQIPKTKLIHSPQNYKWEYKNKDGTVLLETAFGFKNKEQAVENLIYTFDFAKSLENYIDVEFSNGSSTQYGFKVLHKYLDDGEEVRVTLAEHPVFYDTKSERDEIKIKTQELILADYPFKDYIAQGHKGFQFQLMDEAENVMMIGQSYYGSRSIAQSFWNRLISLANSPENFKVTNEIGFAEFYVELWDGKVLMARSPEFFNHKNAATAFIEKIITLVESNPPIDLITKEDLWKITWPDTAEDEDENAELFTEKYQAISVLISKVESKSAFNPIAVFQENKKWSIHLNDDDNQLLLESIEWFEDKKQAACYVLDLMNLAAEKSNYELFWSPDACLVSFNVLNEKGNPTAKHPEFFESEQEANLAIQTVVNYAKAHQFDLMLASISENFSYEIFWENCSQQKESLLKEVAIHESESKSMDALKNLLKNLVRAKKDKDEEQEDDKGGDGKDDPIAPESPDKVVLVVEPDTEGAGFTILAKQYEQTIAWHPGIYSTSKKAKEILRKAEDYLIGKKAIQKDEDLYDEAYFNEFCDVVQTSLIERNNCNDAPDEQLQVFQLRKEDFRIACYALKFKTEAERDTAMKDFCENFNRCLPDFCEPCLEGDVTLMAGGKHYFLIRLKTSGKVLWKSYQGYDGRGAAVEALREQYITIFEAARVRTAYQVVELPDGDFILELLNDNQVIAQTCDRFSNEIEAKQAMLSIIDASLKYPVFSTGKYYGFRWYDTVKNREEWEHYTYYRCPEDAWSGFLELLELLKNKDNLIKTGDCHIGFGFEVGEILLKSKNLYATSIINEKIKQFLAVAQNDEAIYPFVNYTDDCRMSFKIVGQKYKLARHPKSYYTIQEREKMRECLFAANSCGQFQFNYPKFGCAYQCESYYFYIVDDDGNKLWRSATEYDSETSAIAAYNLLFHDIMSAAREPDFYRFGESEDETAVELLNPNGTGIIAVAIDYNENNESQIVTEAVIKSRIEYARRYPVIKLDDDRFGFRIYSTACLEEEIEAENHCDFYDDTPSYYEGLSEIVLENIHTYSSPEQAGDTVRLLESLMNDKRNFARTKEDCTLFSIEITNPAYILAEYPRTYSTEAELDRAIAKVAACINTEGFHLVEHVLLRPKSTNEALLEKVKPCVDREICECTISANEEDYDVFDDYIPGADPFSFWVTIVLPYWSKRFQNPNFREFFEDTLRREAPAHIALRIAWIDPKQMKEFEDKYKIWLKALTLTHHCDYEKIQCDLMDCILKLENVYPLGRLYEQTSTQDEVGPVVLNKTRIG